MKSADVTGRGFHFCIINSEEAKTLLKTMQIVIILLQPVVVGSSVNTIYWVLYVRCPFCSHEETKVTDKRDAESLTRRRRECEKCEKRFTTYEKPEISMTVIKKDGSREPYDREKLRVGMLKSCEKRAIPPESIDEAVSEIESRLLRMESTEIESSAIGEQVMRKLLKLDKVAYLRFASVHRSFEDVARFEKEVKLIKAR